MKNRGIFRQCIFTSLEESLCKNEPFIGLQLVVMCIIPLVRCPRATHEGNKSHNPSLQADNPYKIKDILFNRTSKT